VDRFKRHAMFLAVGSLALPLSFLLLTAQGTQGLWGATVLLGISFSLVPAVLWPAIARYCTAEQLGTAYGLMTALQQGGVFVANIAAGYVNDTGGASAANPAGYDAMLWFFGLLSLAAFVFAALLWRRNGRAPD
jgi:predicted MFS family arabinose efflux permease